MSFLSDLFEGNFDKLGTDITHAPDSLSRHPEEIAELAGGAALIAAPFLIPEIGAGLAGAFGASDLGALAGGELALAEGAGLGAEAATGAGFLGSEALALGGELGTDALAFAPELAEGGADLGSWLADPLAGGAAAAPTDALALQGPETAAAVPSEAAAGPAESVGGLMTLPAGTPPVSATTTGAGGVLPVGSGGVAAPAVSGGAVAGAGGEGGITGMLSSAMASPWTKLALGLAPLGLALGRGQPGLPPQAQSAAALAANPGAAGTLNPSQVATIGNMRNDLTNQWRQVLYNQGIQDPSKDARWPQIAAVIDNQVTAATQQMIQQNIQNALAGNGQLISIAQMQMQADQNFTNTLVNATKSLGSMVGGSRDFRLVPA